jgi:hypothetical protein
MRYWTLGVMLAWCGIALCSPRAGGELSRNGILADMLHDDLTAYLDGGKARFADDWSQVAAPWTTDQLIGMKYARSAVAADNDYGERTIFLHGHYLSAENWIGDTYRVQMALVVAIVGKSESAFLNEATSGSSVDIACKAQGKELEFVYLDRCESVKFAMAGLVQNEMRRMLSRGSAADKQAIAAAAAIDRKLSPDDPCRNTIGGCIDQIHAMLQ